MKNKFFIIIAILVSFLSSRYVFAENVSIVSKNIDRIDYIAIDWLYIDEVWISAMTFWRLLPTDCASSIPSL